MSTTTQPAPTAPTTPFRRPTWQESVASYLPPRHRQKGAELAHHVPIAIAVILLSLLAIRLRNAVFIDEALYINAGQDYLNGWLRGTPVPNHAAGFSGAPVVYPVIAATLDAIGGLWLVRAFSLLLIVITTVCVTGLSQHLFGFRAGVLAGASFALTGPVIFVGALATFDAMAMCLLAIALWLGVTRLSLRTAVLAGMALTAAATVKYTAAVFAPPILVAILLGARRPVMRATAAGVSFVGSLAVLYLLFVDANVQRGIAFTTTDRAALSPTSTEFLLVSLLIDIGPILLVALGGLVVQFVHRDRRLLALALLGAAMLLPAAQIHLGEGVSFSKHTAYSALFLAPLAGAGLQWLSRRTYAFGPVFALLLVVMMVGGLRSGAMHREWVDVTPVVDIIAQDDAPGLYISSSTDAMKYYTRRAELDVAWQTTFALYSFGPDAIRQAVAEGHYQMVILRSESTRNPEQDAGQAVFLDALLSSSDYQALPPIDVREYSDDTWLIFRHVGEGSEAVRP
jgi:hypothetical protein